MSFLVLIIMNIIWAGTYVVVKLGLGTMPPLSLVFWRMGFAAVILFAWIAIKRIPWRLDINSLVRIISLGALTAGAQLLWVTGLEYTNASDASLLYAFEPILGIVLASIILKEGFRPAMGAGLFLAFIGLIILSRITLSTVESLFLPSVAFGNLLVVAGLSAESFYSIIAKPLSKRCSPIVVIAGTVLVIELILAVPIAFGGRLVFPKTLRDFGIIFYLSVPCTVIGYVLWMYIMRKLPVNVMAYTIFVQPVAGPFIATLAIGEVLEQRVFNGGIFLLAGLVITIISHIRAHRKNNQCVAVPIIAVN